MVEGARLESVYRLIPYPGFESPSLRQEIKTRLLSVKSMTYDNRVFSICHLYLPPLRTSPIWDSLVWMACYLFCLSLQFGLESKGFQMVKLLSPIFGLDISVERMTLAVGHLVFSSETNATRPPSRVWTGNSGSWGSISWSLLFRTSMQLA